MAGRELRPDEQYDGERFADVAFDQAVAGNSLFLDCSLAGVSFSDCNLRKCRFTDTAMREVRIVGTDLAETGWQDVTLTGADFTKATCTDVDLRGASLGIAAGFEALRGTTIDSVQLVTLAPQLANHLGITVED